MLKVELQGRRSRKQQVIVATLSYGFPPISIHFSIITSLSFSLLWIHVQKSNIQKQNYYREQDFSLFVMGKSARYIFPFEHT